MHASVTDIKIRNLKSKYRSSTRTTTRQWLEALPPERQELFWQNLEAFKTHELWDWIINLLPLSHAKKILREVEADGNDVWRSKGASK